MPCIQICLVYKYVMPLLLVCHPERSEGSLRRYIFDTMCNDRFPDSLYGYEYR